MELFVVRHGIAAPRGTDVADADRPLTPKGSRRFEQAAEGLKAVKVSFDQLLTSPWRRAAQTAELLEPLLKGDRVDTELLTRAPGPKLLALFVGERVAVVGHEPWMSSLVTMLTHGGEDGDHLALKKGGVAWLEGEPRARGMVLRALLPPKVLRALR